ncbi:MAG: DUF5906 domain-containing protein [Candidatus Tenebribacter burtonii]|nr:DUF5906 domain-containing protein [Candidatus Tenebribacter burtonii]
MKFTDEQVEALRTLNTKDDFEGFFKILREEKSSKKKKKMENHFEVMIGNKLSIVDKNNFNKRYNRGDFACFYSDVVESIEETKSVGSGKNKQSVTIEKDEKLVYKFLDNDIERYDEVVFRPTSKVSDNQYNLWHGWNVEPDQNKSCDRFLNFLKEVICNDNDEVYKYILDWFAQLIQLPEKKSYIPALVLRGEPGVGKGSLLEYVSILLKDNYAHIVSKESLVSKFNSDLSYKLLTFADEVVWSGNPQEANKLKTFISERSHRMELKGKDSTTQENFSRLIIASNNEWVAPIEKSDRRYVVLDVNPKMKNNPKFFESLINNEAKKGGAEALLYLLINRDISTRDWSNVPRSAAKDEQRALTFSPIESWLVNHIEDGPESELFQLVGKCEFGINSKDLYEDYVTWHKKYCSFERLAKQRSVGNLFTRILGTPVKRSNGTTSRLIPIDFVEKLKDYLEVDEL